MNKEFFKDYSRVSPYERFGLVAKALARRDTLFVKRLVNACNTGRNQYARYLAAARECTLQVSLGMQVAAGRWETCNALMLSNLNPDHVEYYYTTFRHFPERVEKINAIVSVLEDVLVEWAIRGDGSDNSDLIERAHEYSEAMADFLFSEDSEMDGGYSSSASTVPDAIRDRLDCQVTCYILGQAREHVIASIGPLWLAFSSACQSVIGLDPEVMLEAFAPRATVDLVDEFRFELDALNPELDTDKDTESALRDLWQCSTS
jgi:hypothetical protein